MNKPYNGMDERALWIRGNVFMHSFMLAIALLMCNGVVQDLHGRWASPFIENLLMLAFLITFTSIELIVRNVYTGPPVTMLFVLSFICLAGLMLLGLGVAHSLQDTAAPWQAGQLTASWCNFLLGGMFLAIPVGYVIRQKLNKKQDNAPDEE